MKKILKFALVALATLGLTIFLDNPVVTEEAKIPAIGPLLSPFTGFWKSAEQKKKAETVYLFQEGMRDSVKIIYNERRVPHIFAKNNLDAFFTQGYILAQHRLWQMDIATRAASGRLSEIMGERTLKMDQQKRRKGMVYGAENALQGWKDKEEYKFIEAFTEGANAFLANLSPEDYPIEFKLIGYQPEAWTPLKTALFNKTMAEMLAGMDEDIEMTNVMEIFGDSISQELFPDFYEDDDPIIPKGTPYPFKGFQEEVLEDKTTGVIHHQPIEKQIKYLGSNNWAVSGKKTQSGFPILCNDPHLSLTLPSIWFEIQITTPDINSYGVCLPGIPGIVIGFNENAAWGVTNVGHDVTDYYQIDWVNPEKTHYWLDGRRVQVKEKIETYKVAGLPTQYDTVKYTHWGPIMYQNQGTEGKDLAMRWVAHDISGNEIRTFFLLNQSKTYEDYRKAIRNFHSPAQNIIFANRAGDIGITVQGNLPIKATHYGKTILPGNKSALAWKGFIPTEELPTVKNPERGFVLSANQHSTDASYPYPYHSMRGGFAAYRGRTIAQKLSAMDDISIQDMMDLQNDVYGLRAAEALPALLSYIDQERLEEDGKRYFEELKHWNYEYKAEQFAPILFNTWFDKFYRTTWDEFYAFDDSLAVTKPESRKTILMLKESPTDGFFDVQSTQKTETARDIAQLSFDEMVTQITTWEKDAEHTDWTNYKPFEMNHIGFIDAFSRKDLKIEGDPTTINAIGKTWGPSWRMIVGFKENGLEAYGIFPGGQSGNPGSSHYDNAVEDWAKGKYYKIGLMKEDGSM